MSRSVPDRDLCESSVLHRAECRCFGCLRFVVVLATCFLPISLFADESAERDFTLKVLPLLQQKCLGCHGGDQNDVKGEYSVVDRENLLKGGESGDPAIVPGKPDESTLYSAISWKELEMPPKENDRLTVEQIAIVRRWIEGGAPWPDDATQV
ncbi:MAG: hypothetical protein O2856_11945 [Planctomycetota bacterium]|nr:hypothetical protein [Planctomycetota bacterium]